MNVPFVKYQATGNDFILIDNRSGQYAFSNEQINHLCDRKFGIGADGIILIGNHPSLDFNLVYFNRDGSQSLCGNGSRAAVHFASQLGIVNGKTRFHAYDGLHEGQPGLHDIIRIKLNDVLDVKPMDADVFINTGSPHLVRFVDAVESFPVFDEGRKIRLSERFTAHGGTNVNFAEQLPDNTLYVRTYERGVENETLSCGTGVTAAALAASQKGYQSPVKIKTRGGNLMVEFTLQSREPHFTDIYLSGPAKKVYEGMVEL
ncbi:diaminopimelate epimerase [Oscillatoria amoena NRMC-F 0135]|nr:diaminopimelate epimerase [Oscillatoria amoena NRMC-F 0135]